MAESKYLDGAGLGRTWEKIKAYIALQFMTKLANVTFSGTGVITVGANQNLLGPVNIDANSKLDVTYTSSPTAGNLLKVNDSAEILFSKDTTNRAKIKCKNGMVQMEIDKYPVAVGPVSRYTGSLGFGVYNLDNSGLINFRKVYAAVKNVNVIAICNSIKTYKIDDILKISFGSSYAHYPVIIITYVSDGADIPDGN